TASSAPAAGNGAGPTASLEQKLTGLKTGSPAVPSAGLTPAAVPPAIAHQASTGSASVEVAIATKEIHSAPAAQSPDAGRIPTLSEFLTHGSNGLELKQREKAQPEKAGGTALLTEESPASTRSERADGAANQDSKPSLSVALGVSQSPAPGSATF